MNNSTSQDSTVIKDTAAATRKKVIVAVHGIGDQFEYATVQSTAIQFCHYYDVPAAVPLGRFHSHLQQIKLTGAFFWGTPPDPPIQELGFAEVYWAGIPREQVKLGYILEESKRWAKTVIERFRAHAKDAEMDISKETYSLIDTVLEEMIETIAILERLTFLAEKAGVFKFDLNGLLVNYLGDVQLVTEFTFFRDQILTEFDNVMDAIMQNNSDADIYIVAHSEGTVVSFKGLLKAMCNTRKPGSDWIKNVRGLMTIGSPIDKHIILWPELWEDVKTPDKNLKLKEKIPWRNYYDYGDPVGFDLESAREWMRDNGWNHFEFEKDKDDIGFSRYKFPGKAHVDYWQDEELFNHFIETVVERNAPPPSSADELKKRQEKKKAAADFAKKPDKLSAKFISYALPYALIFTILFVAVFLIYKAAMAFYGAKLSSSTVAGNVTGLAFLLAGVTVVSRMPRLIDLFKWRLIGFGVFALCAVVYVMFNIGLVKDPTESPGFLITGMLISQPNSYPWLGVLTLSLLVVGLVYGLNLLRPKSKYQMWPLLVIGFLVVIFLVAEHIISIRIDENKTTLSNIFSLPATKVDAQTNSAESTAATEAQKTQEVKDDKDNPIWPLFLALAGFLYLWWLAALIFDLVFAWQRYIRYAGIMKHLDAIKYGKKAKANRESNKQTGGDLMPVA